MSTIKPHRPKPDPLEALKPDEVAKLLDVDRTTVYKLIKQRQLPHVLVGSRIRVVRKDLEAWLAKNRKG